MNYLYPHTIDLFVSRETRRLNKSTCLCITEKLIRWLKNNPQNASIIDNIPSIAPEWAQKKVIKDDFYTFSPSDEILDQVKTIVSFLREMELCRSKYKQKPVGQKADELFSKLRKMSVADLLSKANDWEDEIDRGELFMRPPVQMKPLTCGSYRWSECGSVKQMRDWGKVLDNCLANDHYLDDFLDFKNTRFRCFGLFNSDDNLVSVAASENGELCDFEALGNSRQVRQQNAIKYQDQLQKLLLNQNIRVLGDSLVYRAGMLDKAPLGLPVSTHYDSQGGVVCWIDSVESQLVVAVNCFDDIEVSLLNVEVIEALPVNQIPSLKNWLLELMSLDVADELIYKLTLFPEYKYLSPVLSLLSDCDSSGKHITMFNKSNADIAETKVGQFIHPWNDKNEMVWWTDLADCVHQLDTNHWTSDISQTILDQVIQQYEKKGYFWANLARHSIYLPNLPITEDNKPKISYATFDDQSLAPKDNWDVLDENSHYVLKRRKVDYTKNLKAEQWICFYKEQPCCGALIVFKSKLKREIRLQAPGCDLIAYQLLDQNLPSHTHVDVYYNPQHQWKNKLYADFFVGCDVGNQALNKLEGVEGYWFQKNKMLMLLDDQEQIVLIADVLKGELTDAFVVQANSILVKELPAIMMQIGFDVSDSCPLADRLGLEVVDGKLVERSTLPCVDEYPSIDRIVIDEDEAQIYFNDFELVAVSLNRFEKELELTEYDEQEVDNLKELSSVIVAISDYWRVSVSHDACRLLGLKSIGDDNYRYHNDKPKGWFGMVGNGEYEWYFESDTDLHEPIVVKDGSIQFPLGQHHLINSYLKEIDMLYCWLNG